jgi:hypothetical protein
MQIHQPVPAAVLRDRQQRRRKSISTVCLRVFGHPLENAVEIGGDQPQRAFTVARQLQQGGVGVGRTLEAQIGLQRGLQGLAYRQTLSGQASLQQVQHGIELAA